MPGTADNFVAAATMIGRSKFYVDLGSGSGEWNGGTNVRLILDDDGSPDSSQNPNARHLGYTEAGLEWLIRATLEHFTPDEETNPIISRVQSEEAIISGSMWQVTDMALAEVLIPTATRSDVMGSQGVTIGGNPAIPFTSVAAIAPLQSDPTRFAVFHLYKALNDSGFAAQWTKTKPASSPFAFRGYVISTRNEGDKVGRYYVQNAGAQS